MNFLNELYKKLKEKKKRFNWSNRKGYVIAKYVSIHLNVISRVYFEFQQKRNGYEHHQQNEQWGSVDAGSRIALPPMARFPHGWIPGHSQPQYHHHACVCEAAPATTEEYILDYQSDHSRHAGWVCGAFIHCKDREQQMWFMEIQLAWCWLDKHTNNSFGGRTSPPLFF